MYIKEQKFEIKLTTIHYAAACYQESTITLCLNDDDEHRTGVLITSGDLPMGDVNRTMIMNNDTEL